MFRTPDLSPFAPWLDAAARGDAAMREVLLGSLGRFMRRNGCAFARSPAPGWTAVARIDRGAVAVTDDGLVRSVEFFHVPDLDAFLRDEAERSATFRACAWDDRAAIFTPAMPPRRTRQEPPTLDWDGSACAASAPDQVRRIEYLLNADLRSHSGASAVLQETDGQAHRRLRPELARSLAGTLRDVQGGAASRALDALRACLREDRLDALSRAGSNSVRSYNWLCGQDLGGVDGVLAVRRTQAAMAYPFAWPLLSAPMGEVSEAVREARPLAPAVARALGVSEGDLRRMNGMPASAAGMGHPDAAAAARAARIVARMPPGKPPATDAGWRAFFAAVALADLATRQPSALLATAAGKWDAINPDDIAMASTGLADMVSDLHANLAWPIAQSQGIRGLEPEATRAVLVGARSLEEIARASAWWHASQAEVRLRLGTMFPWPGQAAGGKSWLPLVLGGEPFTAPNGLLLVPLLDEDALRDEHARMGHCINTYAEAALHRGSHLLSVRREGVPLPIGTVEIEQEEILRLAGKMSEPPDAWATQLPPAVKQFKGARNAVPELEGWLALWAYVGAILTGELEVDADGLRAGLAARRRDSGLRLAASGPYSTHYDHRRDGALIQAWKLYSPALPKSASKRGPSAFAEKLAAARLRAAA
jgi:hypothetical protein